MTATSGGNSSVRFEVGECRCRIEHHRGNPHNPRTFDEIILGPCHDGSKLKAQVEELRALIQEAQLWICSELCGVDKHFEPCLNLKAALAKGEAG